MISGSESKAADLRNANKNFQIDIINYIILFNFLDNLNNEVHKLNDLRALSELYLLIISKKTFFPTQSKNCRFINQYSDSQLT